MVVIFENTVYLKDFDVNKPKCKLQNVPSETKCNWPNEFVLGLQELTAGISNKKLHMTV